MCTVQTVGNSRLCYPPSLRITDRALLALQRGVDNTLQTGRQPSPSVPAHRWGLLLAPPPTSLYSNRFNEILATRQPPRDGRNYDPPAIRFGCCTEHHKRENSIIRLTRDTIRSADNTVRFSCPLPSIVYYKSETRIHRDREDQLRRTLITWTGLMQNWIGCYPNSRA